MSVITNMGDASLGPWAITSGGISSSVCRAVSTVTIPRKMSLASSAQESTRASRAASSAAVRSAGGMPARVTSCDPRTLDRNPADPGHVDAQNRGEGQKERTKTHGVSFSKYALAARMTFGESSKVEVIVGMAISANTPSIRSMAELVVTTAATTIEGKYR